MHGLCKLGCVVLAAPSGMDLHPSRLVSSSPTTQFESQWMSINTLLPLGVVRAGLAGRSITSVGAALHCSMEVRVLLHQLGAHPRQIQERTEGK